MIISQLNTLDNALEACENYFIKNELFYGHGTDNAWDEAVTLCFKVLNLSLESSDDVLKTILSPHEKEQICALAKKRVIERTPLPYLNNEAWFAGLNFYVDQRVIIPRSPVAELILNDFKPWLNPSIKLKNVLDLCTGSGCIAVAIAHYYPDVMVDAVDISQEALSVAKKNTIYHQLENRVKIILSDLFSELSGKKYDLIITNPPYVDDENMSILPPEYQHEPSVALAAGIDGLDIIEKILKQAAHFLNPEGILIAEVGAWWAPLEEKFNYPYTWLEFENGGEGVFMLSREQLLQREN